MKSGTTPGRIPEALSTPERQLDPFEWYQDQRSRNPVRFDDTRRTWDVFRYEDVGRVLSEHESFSSHLQSGSGVTMISADPPDHERLRGFATATFSPSSIAQRQDAIFEHAMSILKDTAGDTLEVMRDFAIPLSKTVLADLLAIPQRDRAQFFTWSDAFIIAPDVDIEQTPDGLTDPEVIKWQLTSYLSDLLEDRRSTQQDDLVSVVAGAQDITRDEKLGFFDVLLTAGYSPMVNLITNAVWCLADHNYLPVTDVEALDLTGVVEETLRYRSPIQAMSRTATTDVDLRGHRIESGTRVTAWIGAANRDPAVYDAPETFDPTREESTHLAFGRGIHYCLGAALARLQATEALRALFTVYPDLTATPDRTPLTSPYLHGIDALSCNVPGT